MGDLHRHGRPTPLSRIGWLAGCSALFLVVYGGCNWYTAQRADAGLWYFDWEMNIPLVPAMIVPYWTIDLFFLGSFFMCRDRRELVVHGQRIVGAILVAGLFFLVVPLRIAFPRPVVSGVFGPLFNVLRTFDQPHNLFPSLHITLWLILRAVYVRHTRGALQWAVKLWFVLIGMSTLLTWQHQVVDVLGGCLLATLCFYLFRESAVATPVTPNAHVWLYYSFGCGVALAIGGWLIWPGIAFLLAAAAYLGIGPGVYRKENGRLPLSAKLLLGPLIVGQHLSLLYYRRQCRAWDEVVPGVLIGRMLTDKEAQTLDAEAVLDLTAEFSEAKPLLLRVYRNIPILDLTAPTPEQLREAVAFMREQVRQGRTVYVHCKIGYSRSAAAVGAYLLATGKPTTAAQAVAMLRAARPSVVVRTEAMNALRAFAESL